MKEYTDKMSPGRRSGADSSLTKESKTLSQPFRLKFESKGREKGTQKTNPVMFAPLNPTRHIQWVTLCNDFEISATASADQAKPKTAL